MSNIAILSYWFYPALGAACDRMDNYIRFFKKKGHNVFLFTSRKPDINSYGCEIRTLNFKNDNEIYSSIMKIKPDVVLYSVPPSWGMTAFKRILDKKIPVIFDLRDPLSINIPKFNIIKRNYVQSLEKYLIENSPITVVNSPGIKEYYEQKDIHKVYYFLPNCYSRPIFSEEMKFNGRFIYLGAFNIMHSVENFYKFFKLYKKEISKNGFTFDFYCFTSKEVLDIKKMSAENSFKFVKFHNALAPEEFPEKLKDYSIGLTLVRTKFNYSIPSKFYSYLALGLPTLNISFGRSMISRICRENSLGFDINPEKHNKDFFSNLVDNYPQYQKSVLTNRINFFWENIAEEFYKTELSFLETDINVK